MKKIILLPILMLVLMSLVLGADCVYYTTADYTDGTDFFGVMDTTTNTTLVGDESLFVELTAFTPRLNFTVVVNETIVGQALNGNSTLGWKSFLDVSSTFKIYNNTVLVPASNYSLVQNLTTGVITVNWLDASYLGVDLLVNFTKNFTKNVDDLITTPSSIYTASTTAHWLTVSSPTAYGEDATFQLNSANVGKWVTGQNWAVEWTITNRTCANYAIDESTNSGISNTKNLVYAGLALLSVMILVTVAWGLMQIFRGGDVDFMGVTILAIGGAVLIMLGYIIIYFMATALGA